jgi:C4-dicarboxylate-specific signal transduction histidine kinase
MYVFDHFRVGRFTRRARVLLDATEGRARAEERESRLREELAHIGRVALAGELATSLAHEVNQPLAAIVTNAQAGRRYLANAALDKKNLDEILRDIAQQGQRASDIIRGLREFLRKHQSERRPVDLNDIVRDTLPLVRRELQDHKIALVLKLAPEVAAVDADPIQIQQIVVNLVKNACEAMSDSNSDRTLELRTTSNAGRVGLEVQDTGPGLAPDVADRLFQPYVTTKSTGMGLGLAICRSIVEAHGGRISADSAGDRGTTFHVDLPKRAEEG